MIKFTQAGLDKLESITELSGYIIRYERGTFQSGYCILDSKKVIVLNKFLPLEGRVNAIVEIIPQLMIDEQKLDDNLKKLYHWIVSDKAEATTDDDL